MTLAILRGLQGAGASATIPASVCIGYLCTKFRAQSKQLGILAHAFPPSRARSIAFSTFSAGAPVGGILGLVLGGVLTQLTT
jgi:MFS family permease